MKQNTFLSLVFFLSAGVAGAAGVSLERLDDFDPRAHKLFVNVEADVTGGCPVDPQKLAETFTGLLTVFGFQTAEVDASQLEFAVSVKGFEHAAQQACGLRQLSMARQIPNIRMLRLAPGSSSTRYRLWTTESIVAASAAEVESSLAEQARKDVAAFARAVHR